MVALSAGLLSIATAVLGIVFFSPIRDAMRERRFIAVI
jgi:hypothetical protein